MLLQVLLLLIPHALRIFHHLLLDAAKQAGGQTHKRQQGLLAAGTPAWMKWGKDKRSPFFRLVLPLDHQLRVRRPP